LRQNLSPNVAPFDKLAVEGQKMQRLSHSLEMVLDTLEHSALMEKKPHS